MTRRRRDRAPAGTPAAPAPASRHESGEARPDVHDHIVVLEGVTWADYQRMLEIRGERSVPRLTYLEGRLELMSPSRHHEVVKSVVGRLVEAWCTERGIDITPYGSWTLQAEQAGRGAEADECYVVGDEDAPDRPDLAIEVIWTSGGIEKLDVYRKLKVREVWIWKRDAIAAYALRGERYDPIAASEVLTGIDLAQVARFARVRPMTRAVREYLRELRGR